MFQWVRMIADGTAATNSSDTTEVAVGTATVPTWAKSILQARFIHETITVTTAESNIGYWRLTNDQNTIDPFNFPLSPIAAQLAATNGTNQPIPITVPVFNNVTANDTIRSYAAMDTSTTGVPVWSTSLCFSDKPAPYTLHAQKTAATAGSLALTKSADVTISTVAGRSRDVVGVWNYLSTDGIVTAAEGLSGYFVVSSNAKGWQTQRFDSGIEGSVKGEDVMLPPNSAAAQIYVIPELMPYFDGMAKVMFPDPFPVSGKEDFIVTQYNNRDINDALAPKWRFGLIWRE